MFLRIIIIYFVIPIMIISSFIVPNFVKNEIVPVRIYIDNINSNEHQIINDINKSIEDNINKLYERNVSHLNFSITLFSVCLGLFTIVFGLFYFLKINEIQKELNTIKNLPEEFFKRFYKQQFKDNIVKLFSKNDIVRSSACFG